MSWAPKALAGASILGLSVGGAWWLAPNAVPPNPPEREPPEVVELATEAVEHAVDAGEFGQEQVDVWPTPHAASLALCPADMHWLEGQYCPTGAVSSERCRVEARALGFCMDRFEYPNQLGVLPAVMISFYQAEALCRAEGKRLCTEAEWTFACREPVQLAACNFGHTSKQVRVARFWEAERVGEELSAIDARRSSQASACVSPGGIFDLPGNVQEWVVSEHAAGYPAALKGGRFNQSSIDCERSIQTRLPENAYPHTGMRCCADSLVDVPASKQRSK